jgi:hypothetical protein
MAIGWDVAELLATIEARDARIAEIGDVFGGGKKHARELEAKVSGLGALGNVRGLAAERTRKVIRNACLAVERTAATAVPIEKIDVIVEQAVEQLAAAPSNAPAQSEDPGVLDLPGDPRIKRSHVHMRGVFGDCAENEGVLSISWILDASPHYPEAGLIVIGSPTTSPLIPGYIPNLGCFSCGITGAERLIRVAQKAVNDVKAGLAAWEPPAPGQK